MIRARHKVLHCIRQGTIGGGESHLIDLIEFSNTEVYEPIVLSFSDGAMIDHFKKKNIRVIVIETTKSFDLSTLKRVSALLKELRPALIHIHGTRAFSNLLFATLKSKIPIVYTVHGWSFNSSQSFLRRQVAILAENIFCKRASCVINVSFNNQKTGIKYLSGFQSKVILNGVNLSVFDKGKDFPDVRKELSIPHDAFLIGSIARLTIQKDPLTLIHAFSEFSKTNPKAWLLMVGDGDLKAEAITLAETLQPTKRILFQPFRKDIPAILKVLDVFCLPSLWEGFSIGLLEAMAMGKAVLATGVDGTLEVLNQNKNGLMIAPGDQKELTRKLQLIFDDPDLKGSLEREAYKTITDQLNAKRVAEQVDTIYDSLLR
jgi:glycosyltransferase involved in cell wall biosynthesis